MISAQEALDRLKNGNREFALSMQSGQGVRPGARQTELPQTQSPFAIILSCSDSRVPAEIVFNQGLGDLFVIRVAGNIVAPSQVPWGEKALGGYLGDDRAAWRRYDACALIEDGARVPELLVDQGEGDAFLAEQLQPERLRDACAVAGIDLTLRIQPGYDHSYYFISTFMADHISWHAALLR